MPEQPGEVAATGSHYTWGLWQFIADPQSETLEIVRLRTGNMHLNALPFLEPPALVFLSLESLEFNGDIIDADIGLRHPFLGLTEFSGFDVKGILIGNGSMAIPDSPDLVYAGLDDLRLLNPDGYTRWWNPAEFPVNDGTIFSYNDGLLGAPDTFADYDATLNGYKYFADDLDPDSGLDEITLANRGLFSAGQKNIRHYSFRVGGAGLIFNYAVDASWIFPAGDAPWQAPDDFPAEANQPEPYRISVGEIENTLAYEVTTGTAYGELHLLIDVYDWFDADQNTISCWSADGELGAASSATPSGGGNGYSTYAIDLIPQDITSTDDITLWIAAECLTPDGYAGFVPGEPQGTYFTHTVGVAEYIPQEECGEEVHEYVSSHPITGVSVGGGVFLGDMGLQEVGQHAGKAVIQTLYSQYSTVEITGASIGNATLYFTHSDNNFQHSVDCCPFSGRIALVDPGSVDDEIDIIDVNGNYVTLYDTVGIEVVCLDFDDNGDIWYVGYNGSNRELHHLAYATTAPYYTPVPGDTLSINGQFAYGWKFGDIAIDYEDDKLFILGAAGTSSHYLAAYDISGTPNFLYGRNDVFSGPVIVTSMGSTTRYGRRLDIEIDHSLAEYCRIVVSAHISDSGLYRHELVRLEDDLTTMDVWSGNLTSSHGNLPSQIVISPVAPYDLIATPQNLGNLLLHTCSDW